MARPLALLPGVLLAIGSTPAAGCRRSSGASSSAPCSPGTPPSPSTASPTCSAGAASDQGRQPQQPGARPAHARRGWHNNHHYYKRRRARASSGGRSTSATTCCAAGGGGWCGSCASRHASWSPSVGIGGELLDPLGRRVRRRSGGCGGGRTRTAGLLGGGPRGYGAPQATSGERRALALGDAQHQPGVDEVRVLEHDRVGLLDAVPLVAVAVDLPRRCRRGCRPSSPRRGRTALRQLPSG